MQAHPGREGDSSKKFGKIQKSKPTTQKSTKTTMRSTTMNSISTSSAVARYLAEEKAVFGNRQKSHIRVRD